VLHVHIEVNGRSVTIPSYLLDVNQVVSITEKSRQKKVVTEAIELAQLRGVPPARAIPRHVESAASAVGPDHAD